MFKKIDHIGVAVKDLDEAVRLYRDVFGLKLLEIEEVESQKVKVAKFDIGGVHIELLQPTADDSPIKKFIDKKGEGLHHIAYEVDDIEEQLSQLKQKGVKLINERPTEGSSNTLIAFLHPKSSIILTELVFKGEK
ncbi:methylmalonyl-CoA epimerase [Hippea jasoniae]|uniref:methylmalonyl-CoA epimerase n=1 Tax=Hippea jasoniae TaxID=944479 RepID=UPI00055137F1|nr:methylmalonyl-CoA epimerase [Hippea jasoniae]